MEKPTVQIEQQASQPPHSLCHLCQSLHPSGPNPTPPPPQHWKKWKISRERRKRYPKVNFFGANPPPPPRSTKSPHNLSWFSSLFLALVDLDVNQLPVSDLANRRYRSFILDIPNPPKKAPSTRFISVPGNYGPSRCAPRSVFRGFVCSNCWGPARSRSAIETRPHAPRLAKGYMYFPRIEKVPTIMFSFFPVGLSQSAGFDRCSSTLPYPILVPQRGHPAVPFSRVVKRHRAQDAPAVWFEHSFIDHPSCCLSLGFVGPHVAHLFGMLIHNWLPHLLPRPVLPGWIPFVVNLRKFSRPWPCPMLRLDDQEREVLMTPPVFRT